MRWGLYCVQAPSFICMTLDAAPPNFDLHSWYLTNAVSLTPALKNHCNLDRLIEEKHVSYSVEERWRWKTAQDERITVHCLRNQSTVIHVEWGVKQSFHQLIALIELHSLVRGTKVSVEAMGGKFWADIRVDDTSEWTNLDRLRHSSNTIGTRWDALNRILSSPEAVCRYANWSCSDCQMPSKRVKFDSAST